VEVEAVTLTIEITTQEVVTNIFFGYKTKKSLRVAKAFSVYCGFAKVLNNPMIAFK
jgi:hypothetical protein